MNRLYYPPLKRQNIEKYYKTNGRFYAKYNCQKNYDNVAKDCQYRCVYCDAHIDECGGEPFSLDHFRPIEVFGNKFDGVLKVHPFNLHFSCQKCNVLKTNDWKGCRVTKDGVTYVSGQGYIDRFLVDITDYLEVDGDGFIRCRNNNGPAKYMIGKMLLNRTNRVYLRKRREVKFKAERIYKLLIAKHEELLNGMIEKKLTVDEAGTEMRKLQRLFNKFDLLKLIRI